MGSIPKRLASSFLGRLLKRLFHDGRLASVWRVVIGEAGREEVHISQFHSGRTRARTHSGIRQSLHFIRRERHQTRMKLPKV